MEQPTQTPTGTTGSETPEFIEIEIEGQVEKYTPQQLKEGLMRQQDYTKKTQELSNQKADLERRLARAQGYEQFETLLNNDPGLAQEVANLIENRRANSGPQGQYNQGEYNEPAEFNEVPPVPQEVRDRLAYTEDSIARLELERKVESLQKKYPNADINATVQYALDHNLGVNLEGAYKEMSFDTAKKEAMEKGEKAGAQKLLKLMSEKDLTDVQIGKGSSPNLQGVQLTPEQKQYAKFLHISEDDYLKGMKKRGTDELGKRAEV